MVDYRKQRENMVRQQLANRDIEDESVLEAFGKVPREKFLPDESKKIAYQDAPIPIGLGQTISQPYMVALMTQILDLDSKSKVLEIGTGSGYQAAILAEIADEVYSMERLSSLLDFAKRNISQLGYKNIHLIHGDGTLGYKEASPYNGIIVTAGAPTVPSPLVQQLSIGGRLVIPVGGSYSQVLKKIIKTLEGSKEKDITGCVFVPLVGEGGWEEK